MAAVDWRQFHGRAHHRGLNRQEHLVGEDNVHSGTNFGSVPQLYVFELAIA